MRIRSFVTGVLVGTAIARFEQLDAYLHRWFPGIDDVQGSLSA